MNDFYGFLMEFSQGTTPRKEHLERRYSAEKVQEALDKGYIIEYGKTSEGETKYMITSLGKQIRDE
ncbi:MAG: hypothetical protein IJN11_10990 [Oscillospiraceae bacterium]|nr:hypothetical protein [Ruminococcus sp.]MBQ7014416.1 hypothetical protein [Oscillospiraceae bacterium]